MAISTDSIMKLGTASKVGILCGVCALVIGGYWYSFHRPQMERIRGKESQLSELIRDRNVKREIVKNLEQFRLELVQLDNEFKEALAKLPDKKEIPELLRSVSNLGREAGLEVLLFRPESEAPGEFYAKVPVSLRFTGAYHDIGSFFFRVGTIPRIVNVESFSMAANPKAEEGITELNATCTATTYRFLEQPATGAKGTGAKK